ncbi:MAG: glycosyltransferase family 4 protein [Clostridium saudiense]|uniref:glycosyltransferase family 4 protein n=1 Tax=Clostridium saudiense TaxID=1414720 RepID=UPI00290A07C5|nr:glycosyltransferase family 4 protein [Clostridium saudiense]MDU3520819.1 glycosyltransferase family 4 protein [Clostridium saudiense]
MLNICFLSGDMSRTGGTERVLSIIANELSKQKNKFNIHILSITNENNTSYFNLENEIKNDRILKSKDVNFKKQYFQVVKGIRHYIKENNIDILIDVEVIASLFSIPATRFTKTKLISWEHFNFYEDNGSHLRIYARKLAARFSNCIITLTEHDKQNYLNNLDIKGKVEYIYNPIEEVDDVECNIKSKQIISVGRLTYQKGFDMLCDVAKVVLKDNKGWKWLILGDGEDKDKLRSKIKEYGLENKLILKGNVSNVEEYYKNSSLYVMTSRFEGLPMTLLEAKTYKLPIVSFNCLTGPSEIVKNNINGYLINPENVEAMSNKLNILMNDENKLKEFSSNAQIDIEKFELKPIIERWIEVLENV